uniref:Uncharacterized protein n=1 Tax=Ditylenchus dipsaci TaxID=166011 RepID=A0A915ECF4_9BILA
MLCASLCFPDWYEKYNERYRRMEARNCYHCRQSNCCCGHPSAFPTTFPSASTQNILPTTPPPTYVPSSVEVKY